jgi:DNA-directed RNA polymerase specialized sigma24 family protein
LLNQGFTYSQIAKQAHVSFSDIKRIMQKVRETIRRWNVKRPKKKKGKVHTLPGV